MANTGATRNPRSTATTTALAFTADTYWADLEETERHGCIDRNRSRPLGDKIAWDISGCLKERWQIELYPAFRDIINEAGNYEEIYGKRFRVFGRRRRHPICVLHLFMVGNHTNWRAARPTVVVACGDPQIATRTVSLISDIESIKSLKLGFSFLTHKGFVPFAGAHGRFDPAPTSPVNLCGSSALFPSTESINDLYSDHCPRATIGGVLRLAPSAFYGLTVAHVFFDGDDDDTSPVNSIWTDEDVQHSYSEGYNEPSDEDIPSIPVHAAYLENYVLEKDQIRSKAFPAGEIEAKPRNPSFLGYLNPREGLSLSTTNEYQKEEQLRICHEMDWALVRIHDIQYWKPNTVSVNTERVLTPRFVSPKHSPPDGKVVVAAGPSGVYDCYCSGTVCGIILPGSAAMQDAWYMESESRPGDCGAWVMNPENGAVHAIVVATLRESRFTYVLPAEDVFSSVMERCGTEIGSTEDMFLMEAPGKLTYDVLPLVLDSLASDILQSRTSTDWASRLSMFSTDGSKKPSNDADSTYESVQLGETDRDQRLSSSVDCPGPLTNSHARMERQLARPDRSQSPAASPIAFDVAGQTRETGPKYQTPIARITTTSPTSIDFALLKIATGPESIEQSTSAPDVPLVSEGQSRQSNTNEGRFSLRTGQQKPEIDTKQQISLIPTPNPFPIEGDGSRETKSPSNKISGNADFERKPSTTVRPLSTNVSSFLVTRRPTGQQVASSLDSTISSGIMSNAAASSSVDGTSGRHSPSGMKPEAAKQPRVTPISETLGSIGADTVRRASSINRPSRTRLEAATGTTRSSKNTNISTPPGPEPRTMPTVPEGRQLGAGRQQDLTRLPPQVTDDIQTLGSRYRRPLDAKKFFERGRVFALLWHESTAASGRSTALSNASDLSRYSSEEVSSKILRVVVVKEGHGFSLCLPINTYGGRGVSKPDLSKEDRQAHAVIYMSDTQPGKLASETDLIKQPIAVDKASTDQTLAATSRINFSKIHTVEWNVKVMNVGKVSRKSMPYLMGYWQNTMSSEKGT